MLDKDVVVSRVSTRARRAPPWRGTNSRVYCKILHRRYQPRLFRRLKLCGKVEGDARARLWMHVGVAHDESQFVAFDSASARLAPAPPRPRRAREGVARTRAWDRASPPRDRAPTPSRRFSSYRSLIVRTVLASIRRERRRRRRNSSHPPRERPRTRRLVQLKIRSTRRCDGDAVILQTQREQHGEIVHRGRARGCLAAPTSRMTVVGAPSSLGFSYTRARRPRPEVRSSPHMHRVDAVRAITRRDAPTGRSRGERRGARVDGRRPWPAHNLFQPSRRRARAAAARATPPSPPILLSTSPPFAPTTSPRFSSPRPNTRPRGAARSSRGVGSA